MGGQGGSFVVPQVAGDPFQRRGERGIVHGQGDPPIGQTQGPGGGRRVRCVAPSRQQAGDVGADLFQRQGGAGRQAGGDFLARQPGAGGVPNRGGQGIENPQRAAPLWPGPGHHQMITKGRRQPARGGYHALTLPGAAWRHVAHSWNHGASVIF